ncbi:hypothetical protein QN277_020726 [Acacia crassicarpa]|nr:hypothetical protein QN277_020726 [Acacia crassicarpa]
MNQDHVEFEFPTAISDSGTNAALQNDIVFCGKILGRQTDPNPSDTVRKNPFLVRSESIGKINSGRHSGLVSYLKSSSDGEHRRRNSWSWRYHNGLFGVLKYPVQMELSDIKTRQERMEPTSLPKLPAVEGGETEISSGRKSKWGLVRRLSLKRRERGPPMTAVAKGSFGCLPIPLA